MALDLNPFRPIVEDYMLDTVMIFTEGEKVYDRGSGQYVSDRVPVYEGKAFLGPMGTPGRTQIATAETPSRTTYELGIPIAVDGVPTPEVSPEMKMVVLTSQYNPNMVGKIWKVDGQVESTFAVHRRIAVTRDVSRHES